MNKYLGLILILALVISYGSAISLALNIQPTQGETGPAANELHYVKVPTEQVPSAIGNTIDIYLFGLRPQQVENLPANARYLAVPSGLVDIIANPAPVYTKTYEGENLTIDQIAQREGVPKGAIVYVNHTVNGTYVEFGAYPGKGINPFAFRDVRFALNYLIDRSFIVSSIYRGFAAPMYTFLSEYDPDYTTIADIIQEYQFQFNPTKAQQLISKALTAAGATFKNGKWYYDGKPITITFVIRVEDERKDIGNLLANALSQIGFTVKRNFMSFGQAIYVVYFTNPADLKWHLYTEGWGKGAIDKWDYGTICQFGAPWYGWMPGLGVTVWWNYHNETIDELTKKIYFGEFKSLQERNWLYRNASLLILRESVRIWVATRLEIQPYASYVTGITEDLGAGLRSPLNLRELNTPNGIVRIGHLWVWTTSSIWNPWGGFEDVYSVDIMRATYDPATWRHPFNGEPIPFRVTYTVETAGPEGTMDVPSNAVIWDAVNNKWVEVGPGVKAKSKVTLDFSKYLGSKWHDGTTITWADLIGELALNWEIAYDPVKSNKEANIAGPLKSIYSVIKGYVFHFDKGTVDIYVDYWHFDPNYIADYVAFGTTNPIELHIIMFELAFTDNKYALSQDRSEAEGIPTLDLVVPQVAQDVRAKAEELISAGKIPDEYKGVFNVEGKQLLTDNEFVQRLQNLVKWIDDHGHAWVSQGPFYIDSFDKDAQTAVLKAFRDPSYPFHPGDWFFGTPIKTKILSINTRPLIIGKNFTMTISVSGAGTITVKWMLVDPASGKVLLKGEATPSAGAFVISLPESVTEELTPYYTYSLVVIAYSDQVAMPDVETATITTYPYTERELQRMQEQLAQLQSNMASQLSDLEQRITSTLGGQVASALRDLKNSLLQALTNMTAAMTQNIGDLRGDISDVGGRIDALRADINTLKGGQEDLSSKIDQLSGTLGTLQILEIIILILVLIAIIVPFIRKK